MKKSNKSDGKENFRRKFELSKNKWPGDKQAARNQKRLTGENDERKWASLYTTVYRSSINFVSFRDGDKRLFSGSLFNSHLKKKEEYLHEENWRWRHTWLPLSHSPPGSNVSIQIIV